MRESNQLKKIAKSVVASIVLDDELWPYSDHWVSPQGHVQILDDDSTHPRGAWDAIVEYERQWVPSLLSRFPRVKKFYSKIPGAPFGDGRDSELLWDEFKSRGLDYEAERFFLKCEEFILKLGWVRISTKYTNVLKMTVQNLEKSRSLIESILEHMDVTPEKLLEIDEGSRHWKGTVAEFHGRSTPPRSTIDFIDWGSRSND